MSPPYVKFGGYFGRGLLVVIVSWGAAALTTTLAVWEPPPLFLGGLYFGALLLIPWLMAWLLRTRPEPEPLPDSWQQPPTEAG